MEGHEALQRLEKLRCRCYKVRIRLCLLQWRPIVSAVLDQFAIIHRHVGYASGEIFGDYRSAIARVVIIRDVARHPWPWRKLDLAHPRIPSAIGSPFSALTAKINFPPGNGVMPTSPNSRRTRWKLPVNLALPTARSIARCVSRSS